MMIVDHVPAVRPRRGRKALDPYRRLLVEGINVLVESDAISLDPAVAVARGHLFATVAGAPSVIAWTDIGFDEVRVSVWWHYDHARHPQAEGEGASRECFVTTLPLAKRQHYPRFVGAAASGWLERRKGAWLQGRGRSALFDLYLRSSSRGALRSMPAIEPVGYEAEGTMMM